MRMRLRLEPSAAAAAVLLASTLGGSAQPANGAGQSPQSGVAAQSNTQGNQKAPMPGLGKTPGQDLVRAWNIDITPDGSNLPDGSGSVSQGKELFANTCAACHGAEGVEGPMDRLVGGKGSLGTKKPIKTVGSYWPYATTLYDYIHRAMPFNAPQSLTPNQVYAAVAYVLYLNGIVPENAVMDKHSLPKVEMPNRNGFVQTDTVTLAKRTECMKDCKPFAVEGAGLSPDESRPIQKHP